MGRAESRSQVRQHTLLSVQLTTVRNPNRTSVLLVRSGWLGRSPTSQDPARCIQTSRETAHAAVRVHSFYVGASYEINIQRFRLGIIGWAYEDCLANSRILLDAPVPIIQLKRWAVNFVKEALRKGMYLTAGALFPWKF